MKDLHEGCLLKAGKELDELEEKNITPRHCTAVLLNNWDVDITDVTLKHTCGDNNVYEHKFPLIKKTESTKPFQILYVTGPFSPHDYWWIEFTANGGKHPGTWTCKNNFYCDLRASDAKTVVQIQVSAGDERMYITESSGQCYVSLHHNK